MSKRQKLTVSLPNLTPTITLPRHLGRVLQHVIDSGSEGVNSFELTRAGSLNPTRAISDLRKRGALISRELRDVEDSFGEIHPGVAHYIYCGWHFDAAWQHNTTNPYKESA
jgi:hypothetical protein